jgi:hypothetical protein
VSTTQIGDFLTGSRKESILDKLVSTSVSEKAPAEPVKTEAVQPRETATAEANRDLLRKLTETSGSLQTDQVALPPSAGLTPGGGGATSPVETPTGAPQEEVKKSVLDRLTQDGDSGHA